MPTRLWIAALLLCAAPSAALAQDANLIVYASADSVGVGGVAADGASVGSVAADSATFDPRIYSPPPLPSFASILSEASAARNPRRALLYSLLLPGAGELYLEHKGRATGFFVSEGAIWANYIAWQISGDLRQNDYIEQARINAGVGVDSESDDYWRLVGIYDRSSGSGPGAYEEELRRNARNEFPTDPAAQDAYVAERLPTGDRAWDWSTETLQQSYVKTRQYAKRAFNKRNWSIGFAILNRIASAIDTQFLHRRDSRPQRSALDEGGTHLLATMTADGGGRVLLRHRF